MTVATILLWGCLLAVSGQVTSNEQGGPGKTSVSIDVLAEALATRERLFFESESILIQCGWGATDHLFLDEAEEKRLLQMMQQPEFDTNAFPQQKIMRTPGYRYELGKRGKKLYQKVVNPLDLKYGPGGLTAAFDGNLGVELQEHYHAIIQQQPPAFSWQNWDYAFLQHLNVYKYVEGLDAKKVLPAAVRPLSLPQDLLEERETYSISGEEVVNGVRCVVLDKTDEARFWLDPEKGYAVRQVFRFIPGKQRGPGSQKTAVSMAEFREVRPGLWLPWAITEEIYYSTERGPASLVGQPAVRRTMSVQSIEFDQLSDAFFELRLPADVLVHDNIRNIRYVNQKEGVPFSKAIDYANQHLSAQARGGIGTMLLIIGNVALVAVLVWLLLFRRDHKATGSEQR
jgi:hypothetical protein